MNEMGKQRCEELQAKRETEAELMHRLTRIKNMSMLCHCSAEIDQGSLLYFSVNNMFLGSGDYLLLLFSEISPPTEEQKNGLDIFSRAYVYAIIEDVISRLLSGHFTFYSSELDGRLVVLILFHYGLLPAHRAGLLEHLSKTCEEVSDICKREYDIKVVSYISEVMNRVESISFVYHKMLSLATLHRYTGHVFSRPVVYMLHPKGTEASPYQLPVRECAKTIANAVVDRGDYHAILTRTLDAMVDNPIQSTDELKARFGDLFEALCAQLRLRGVRLHTERLRTEQFQLLMEESSWSRPVQWLHHTLDQIAGSCDSTGQSLLMQNLEQAQRYIQARLSDPSLSAEGVAEAVGISTTNLSVTFRQQLQTTPAKYIRSLRLTRAMELLQIGDCSIQQICAACGFGSLETFHRVFKAEYGTTPGKLKRLNQTAEQFDGT